MALISALLCEPRTKPRIEQISNDKDDLAKLLTGTFYAMDLGEGLCAAFDADGNTKIKDLNRVIDGCAIFGLCIFCRLDETGDLQSLHEDELENMRRLLA